MLDANYITISPITINHIIVLTSNKINCLSFPAAQYFVHLTNLQTMFPWSSPAKTPLSPQGTTCLLGYSQALTDHHFVMAARFSKTLKNKVRVTAQWLLPGPFGIPGLVTLFFLPEVRFLLFALCIVQGSC